MQKASPMVLKRWPPSGAPWAIDTGTEQVVVPDVQPEGEPLVRNGLTLCTLHHAAFDRAFVGLRPDYVIEVRPDILHEDDGPTLVHAIQALHGTRILLHAARAHRPDPGLVERHYARFRFSIVPTE
jgi:putative restriction endonuclease